MKKQISYLGNSNWPELDSYLSENRLNNILLVTGKKMYAKCGAKENLDRILMGKNVSRVSDFETNPKAEDIIGILEKIEPSNEIDAIIAVGGGSVIDVSKLIKAFWGSRNPVLGCLNGNEDVEPAPMHLIALPTTAGSGSEATHFAVVYYDKTKYSIAHEELLPDLALVVPSFLESLPNQIAAASGMDALCQGIESYWSIYATSETRKIARRAIELAWRSLESAVLHKDAISLENIARASHMAGKAINLTKTTAPHAVSYALTSFYGVLHGHAVGLLVPAFLRYNEEVTESDCLDKRGTERVKGAVRDICFLLGCENVNAAVDALYHLMDKIGLETRFLKLGISGPKDIQHIINHGFNPERVNNNPRKLTEENLYSLLEGLI